jgi:hypothetical protein
MCFYNGTESRDLFSCECGILCRMNREWGWEVLFQNWAVWCWWFGSYLMKPVVPPSFVLFDACSVAMIDAYLQYI